MKEVQLQDKITVKTVVDHNKSAKAVGSGDVEVYATPMMVALMEQAAKHVLSQFLEDGETSVGIHMSTSHDAATPIGMEVSATAIITEVKGRIISFEVIAEDACGVIGKGIHKRAVVKTDSFLKKTQEKLEQN